MQATATKPGAERETLLWMPAYDFNWQFTYEFVEAYKAPAGTVFDRISHHANSANNPFNPPDLRSREHGGGRLVHGRSRR